MEPQLNQEVIKTAAAHDGPIETDAVIVGAGPVGLFQVFELGLLEIKAHVIDSLAYPGGQPIELYPDKPIYDIPAIPVCTGKELTDALLKQIEPFGATFHLGQTVTVVQQQDDGRFFVETSKGTRFLTKTIFIAAGVGAFEPRTLKVDGLDKFQDSQLFYRVRNPADFAGKNLVIVGGGDSALDWTLNFVQDGANKADSVILVHRRDGFRAAPASVAKMRELCEAYEMQFIVGQITGIDERDERLVGGAGGAVHAAQSLGLVERGGVCVAGQRRRRTGAELIVGRQGEGAPSIEAEDRVDARPVAGAAGVAVAEVEDHTAAARFRQGGRHHGLGRHDGGHADGPCCAEFTHDERPHVHVRRAALERQLEQRDRLQARALTASRTLHTEERCGSGSPSFLVQHCPRWSRCAGRELLLAHDARAFAK